MVAHLLGQGKIAKRRSNAYGISLELPRFELEPKKADDLNAVDLTPEQFEIIQRYGTLLNWWVEQSYQEGLRKGSSMLTKMATGELNIDQINDMHIKRGDI